MYPELLNYISNNLDSKISLDSLSKVSGYSPFFLHRKFKEEYGEAIGSYLMRQRIETAAYLLAVSKLPISEIKFLVGYSTDSSFNKAFKKILYISPRSYRENNQFRKSLNEIEVRNYLSLNFDRINLPEQQAIFFPGIGDYFSKEIYSVWGYVSGYLKTNGFGEEEFNYYAILHVCQNVTSGKANRYDAVIVPRVGIDLSVNKYFKTKIGGGRYVRYKLCCTVEQFQHVSLTIANHLEDHSISHGTGPSYLKYDRLPDFKNPDNLFMEWFIPNEG